MFDERDAQVLDLVGRGLVGYGDVLLALGRGDPDRPLALPEDRVERGHETTRPPGVLPPARLATRERHRSPVGDDDGPSAPALGHGCPLSFSVPYTPSSLAKTGDSFANSAKIHGFSPSTTLFADNCADKCRLAGLRQEQVMDAQQRRGQQDGLRPVQGSGGQRLRDRLGLDQLPSVELDSAGRDATLRLLLSPLCTRVRGRVFSNVQRVALIGYTLSLFPASPMIHLSTSDKGPAIEGRRR